MADHAERRSSWVRVVAAAAVALVAVIGLLAWGHGHSLEPVRVVGDVAPTGPRPPSSADPEILARVGLRPSDVGPGWTVSLIDEGDQLSQPTLDFCGLRFASEARREARRQVAARSASSEYWGVSTEAVLYRDQASAAEAMGELRGIGSRCPSGPVPGSVPGEPTLVWRVANASTSGWPGAGSLDRVALSVKLAEPGGDPTDQVVVYLRRGRLLLGVYFSDAPDSDLAGGPGMGDAVDLFARRIAALPASDVS